MVMRVNFGLRLRISDFNPQSAIRNLKSEIPRGYGLNYFLRDLNTIQRIMATTRPTMRNAVHMPALKIPSTASQLLSSMVSIAKMIRVNPFM